MPDIETAIANVERLKKQVENDRKNVEDARALLNSSEVKLINAQNELGKLLEVSGVVGSDFRLVNRQKADSTVRASVFGEHVVG